MYDIKSKSLVVEIPFIHIYYLPVSLARWLADPALVTQEGRASSHRLPLHSTTTSHGTPKFSIGSPLLHVAFLVCRTCAQDDSGLLLSHQSQQKQKVVKN